MSTGSLQLQSRCLTPGAGPVAMLMLLSLCMALVGAESGAEGGGAFGHSWRQRSKVEEETAAICRTGGWRGRGLWSPYPRYHCGC